MPWLLMLALTWGEVWLTLRAVRRLGLVPVGLYVALAAFLGISIAVRVGRRAMLATRLAAARGHLPAREAMAGVVLGFGGFLLALPGVLTDLLALPILLSPRLRLRLADRLVAGLEARMGALAGRMGAATGGLFGGRGPINTTARRIDPPDDDRRLR